MSVHRLIFFIKGNKLKQSNKFKYFVTVVHSSRVINSDTWVI